MSSLDQLESQIKGLTADELEAFRDWFANLTRTLGISKSRRTQSVVLWIRWQAGRWQTTRLAAQRLCDPLRGS